MNDKPAPKVTTTEHGPYRVEGDVEVYDADGNLRKTSGIWFLCRCGGSRNKPFCDVTHGMKGFDGTEVASHDTIAERRAAYPDGEATVFDDRSRCAHFGQCTAKLPQVFRSAAEPFVDPTGAEASQAVEVVRHCPSGALAYALSGRDEPIEEHRPASIHPIVDGPYRLRGAIPVIAADGTAYEVRERQTLCRCGQSRNKPFCDGSHWYAGFRDPAPVDGLAVTPTPLEFMGGLPALEALMTAFYDGILSEPDPVLEPVFRGMDVDHPKKVAAWLAETFGGPADYTAHRGGYEHMLAMHQNRGLTEAQRRRWVERLVDTADQVGVSADIGLRSTLLAYFEWGSRLAIMNSQPDAHVVAHAPVPLWGWGQTPPYVPQPWDPPDAAADGRRRYAAEQAQRAAHNPATDQGAATGHDRVDHDRVADHEEST